VTVVAVGGARLRDPIRAAIRTGRDQRLEGSTLLTVPV
jgi:hypothetical protein